MYSVNDQTYPRSAFDVQSTNMTAILAAPQIVHSVVKNYLPVSARLQANDRPPRQVLRSIISWWLTHTRAAFKRHSVRKLKSRLHLERPGQLLPSDPLHGRLQTRKVASSCNTSPKNTHTKTATIRHTLSIGLRILKPLATPQPPLNTMPPMVGNQGVGVILRLRRACSNIPKTWETST